MCSQLGGAILPSMTGRHFFGHCGFDTQLNEERFEFSNSYVCEEDRAELVVNAIYFHPIA
jgi:hypothetical protein